MQQQFLLSFALPRAIKHKVDNLQTKYAIGRVLPNGNAEFL
jgi:hypothetical protein